MRNSRATPPVCPDWKTLFSRYRSNSFDCWEIWSGFTLNSSAFFVSGIGPAHAEPLVRLSVAGPWPGVSRLIAYNGRIWFVNSRPFENFNAADLYSYSPVTGEVRYERGLASQDVGEPAVVAGQLYWPFEDPRSNLGLGEYAITDGLNWSWNVFTEGRALHDHAMTECGGNLVAATGGWIGALQVSSDKGDTWSEVYRHPTPDDQPSRITGVIEFDKRCVFAVAARNLPGPKLFTWNGEVHSRFSEKTRKLPE